MELLKETEKKMQAALEHLKHEFRGLRTGRANPALVENVQVLAYGAPMRLMDIATISVPEARVLLITPFDASNAHAIAKGIDAANLNVLAHVDGSAVRVKIPEMDASVRQERIKQAKKFAEEAKVRMRTIRRDANETAKKQKGESKITEDDLKRLEKKVQELTDQFCKKIDETTADKEKEILSL